MEATQKPVNEIISQENVKEKTSFGKKFMNFLMYGGFLVIIFAGIIVAILVSMLLK